MIKWWALAEIHSDNWTLVNITYYNYEWSSKIINTIKSDTTWNNQEIYYYQDRLGSTKFITDESWNILQNYSYDDYGKIRSIETSNNSWSTILDEISNLLTDRLYAWYTYDSEIDLYFLKNRHYSAELWRFIQTDPIEEWDDVNLYTYTKNNPLNWVDPEGTKSSCRWEVIPKNPNILNSDIATANWNTIKKTLRDKIYLALKEIDPKWKFDSDIIWIMRTLDNKNSKNSKVLWEALNIWQFNPGLFQSFKSFTFNWYYRDIDNQQRFKCNIFVNYALTNSIWFIEYSRESYNPLHLWHVPLTAGEWWNNNVKWFRDISSEQVKPWDIIIFNEWDNAYHIGFYLSKKYYISARENNNKLMRKQINDGVMITKIPYDFGYDIKFKTYTN